MRNFKTSEIVIHCNVPSSEYLQRVRDLSNLLKTNTLVLFNGVFYNLTGNGEKRFAYVEVLKAVSECLDNLDYVLANLDKLECKNG